MFKIILVLIFTIFLISGFAYLLKIFNKQFERRSSSGGNISKLEDFPIDYKRRLILLKCYDKKYIVLTGGSSEYIIEHKD